MNLHLENLNTEPVPLVINWPEQSISSDLERQILTSVSQYLADRNDVYQASSASLLAGSIEAESKANIIENDDGGDDVFVHISAVQESGLGTLNDNDHVNFEIVENRGKNAASNLSKIDSTEE